MNTNLVQQEDLFLEKQNELDAQIGLPYKLYGFQYKQTPKVGFIAQNIFSTHKIPQHFIMDHLIKIYKGYLYASANQDTEFLQEYLESNFAQKIITNLEELNKKNYQIKIIDDVNGISGEPVINNHMVCDMTVVRGLSVNRQKNGKEDDYYIYVDIDDMGLVVYTPKYLSDYDRFIVKSQSDTIYEESRQVVLRILLEIQSPLKMEVTREGLPVEIPNDEYNWRHLALFETQMIEPAKFNSYYKSENYQEWLSKFKFGIWKLVDIDNYMMGNPLILGGKQNQYTDEVFKGSKFDPRSYIDLKKVS